MISVRNSHRRVASMGVSGDEKPSGERTAIFFSQHIDEEAI
jgi:hypothetical protein